MNPTLELRDPPRPWSSLVIAALAAVLVAAATQCFVEPPAEEEERGETSHHTRSSDQPQRAAAYYEAQRLPDDGTPVDPYRLYEEARRRIASLPGYSIRDGALLESIRSRSWLCELECR